ncbi:FBD-associated F-box protein At5g22730 [Raphanus sativus]|uniref:FBD-associated F-box protein At5g22730 n=1 Tax=Raphanus sativus TaxID=3726 RepID=A0A9W3CVM6_RAPSA|nr:FBD-associated F-box protein At5g22730-like [Raphanus sativus]XP_056855642.1 FBD-associated F-box protein At5g22730 [Raphanus sativus]
MKIIHSTFRFILKIKPLPQFCNLSCLEAKLYFWDMDILLQFLEICPNLTSLILDLSHPSMSLRQTRFTHVAECLLSSLEFVEIASPLGGLPVEIEPVRYFAENSVVLKKLSLRLKPSMDEEDSVALRDLLLALPTLSSACEIVVC